MLSVLIYIVFYPCVEKKFTYITFTSAFFYFLYFYNVGISFVCVCVDSVLKAG